MFLLLLSCYPGVASAVPRQAVSLVSPPWLESSHVHIIEGRNMKHNQYILNLQLNFFYEYIKRYCNMGLWQCKVGDMGLESARGGSLFTWATVFFNLHYLTWYWLGTCKVEERENWCGIGERASKSGNVKTFKKNILNY